MAAALAFIFRIKTEMHQRIVPLAGFHNHVSATPAIAAGWPAARDELLPAECHAAIPTVAGFYPDPCLIYEHAISILAFSKLLHSKAKGEDAGSSPRVPLKTLSL